MKKLLLLLPLAAAITLVIWAVQRKAEPPAVPFTKIRRETLVSVLSTNGKVEPFEWRAVRAEAAGLVVSAPVHEGDAVAPGALLAALSGPSLAAETAAAEARLAETRSALAVIEGGGRAAELSEIETSLERARFDREEAQRDYAALERLAAKNAATRTEVSAAKAKVRQAELAAEALEKRRAALIGKTDRMVAEARVRDAEAALALARQRAALTSVRAPIGGVVYQLAIRPGSYLAVGDAVANVGRMDRVRVRVYVDEPELGRIAEGQPVTITWDALPAKEWTGSVEKKPTSIQTLGTRQVGEVICTIENPGRELIPGTNVNAGIRTAVAPNALVAPKEALRRDAEGNFLFVLRDGAIARQGVKTGISSITRVEISGGASEGDLAALPSDATLKPGDRVKPVVQ